MYPKGVSKLPWDECKQAKSNFGIIQPDLLLNGHCIYLYNRSTTPMSILKETSASTSWEKIGSQCWIWTPWLLDYSTCFWSPMQMIHWTKVCRGTAQLIYHTCSPIVTSIWLLFSTVLFSEAANDLRNDRVGFEHNVKNSMNGRSIRGTTYDVVTSKRS
jgi:hypothetical protein